MKISPYKPAGKMDGYEDARDRVLLLKSSDIDRLKTATEQKGITLVPLEMKAGNFVKLVIGLAVGRKKFDKREVIKKRDLDREMRGGKTRR
jgi:SsrA-binding protein